MAAPPPVPPIVDADRYVSYSPTAPTSVFAVPFPVFGDGSDLAVYLNGSPTGAYAFASASGVTLSSIALPVTDGQITLNAAISTGTLEVFGLWRPRQGILDTSPGINRREYQEDLGQVVASLRELWENIVSTFPLSKVSRALAYLGFDAQGNPIAVAGVTPGAVPVSAPMVPVLNAASYPAALSLMGFSTWFQGLIGTTSSASFFSALGATSFGANLLAAANAAAALTSLGVSAFMQTVLSAANAAAALTTLGLTTFGQSLVTAANAAAALTTLGFSSLAQSVIAQPSGGQMLNLLGYGAPRRQTVVGGPINAANGNPGFLPATSASLNLTSQGLTTSAPLVVSAANGAMSGGANDLIGQATANLTWSGLSPNTTNYLYVTVAANGSLATGSTILAPTYVWGGTPSAALGQFTFQIGAMQGFMGNGSAAPQANVVFVGEAVTSTTGVTSTVAYQYNGRFVSALTAIPAGSSQTNTTHNLGVPPLAYRAETRIVCVTANNGYPVGCEIDIALGGGAAGVLSGVDSHTATFSADNTVVINLPPFAGGNVGVVANANWNFRVYATRNF